MQGERNKIEPSEITNKFVATLFEMFPKNISQAKIAKNTGVSEQKLSNFKCNRRNLQSEELKKLMDTYNGDWDKLRAAADQEPEMLYRYWDILYPDEDTAQNIYRALHDSIEESGVSREEITEKTKIIQSYLSRMECGRQKVAYEKIELIAEAIGKSPVDIIKKLVINPKEKVAREKCLSLLKEARITKGYTPEDMAKKLKISLIRYEGYENGRHNITVRVLVDVAKILDLDFDVLSKYALDGKFVKDVEKMESLRQKTKVVPPNSEKKSNNIITVIQDISTYKYVEIMPKMCQHRPVRRIEGHTFATLLLLVLTNNFRGFSKHRNDILYYLHNMEKEGNISERLCAIEYRGLSTGAKINGYRKDCGITFQNITDCHHYAKGYMSNLLNHASNIPLIVCCEIPPLVTMPASIAIEDYFIQRKKRSIPKEDKSTTLKYQALINRILSAPKWSLWDEELKGDVICQALDIITGWGRPSERPFEQYEKLKELDGLLNVDILTNNKK